MLLYKIIQNASNWLKPCHNKNSIEVLSKARIFFLHISRLHCHATVCSRPDTVADVDHLWYHAETALSWRTDAWLQCITPESRTEWGLPSLLLDGRETDVDDIVVSLCTTLIQESDVRLRYVTVDLVRNHRFLWSTEFSRRNNYYKIEWTQFSSVRWFLECPKW